MNYEDTMSASQFFGHYREPNSEVMRWLDDMASKHMSVKDAISALEPKLEKYMSDRYDRMFARAKDDVDQYFLWYPHPNWHQVASYFEDDYRERLEERDYKARAGGIISRDHYDYMADRLPPLNAPRELLDRYGCVRGFLEGEPYGTGPNGEDTYRAYGMRADGTCLYLGLSPRSRSSEYPPGRGSLNRRAPARSKALSSRCLKKKTTAKTKPRASKPKASSPQRKPKSKGGRR